MNYLDQYEELRSKWQAKAGSDRVKLVSNMVWKDVLRTDRYKLFVTILHAFLLAELFFFCYFDTQHLV